MNKERKYDKKDREYDCLLGPAVMDGWLQGRGRRQMRRSTRRGGRRKGTRMGVGGG